MVNLKKYYEIDELKPGNIIEKYENINYDISNYKVNTVTGGFIAEQVDFELEDMSGKFKVTRRYDSLVEVYGWMAGCRWMFNIESVMVMINNQILIILPDSQVERFDITDNGYYNVNPASGYILMGRDDGGYVLFEREEVKQYDYNYYGKIESIMDKNSNKTSFEYNGNELSSVVLSSGLMLGFTYEDGHVSCITDSTGRSIIYQYDGDYLVRVLYPDNTGIIYNYNENGTIQSVIDRNSVQYITNNYDEKGRVVEQKFANGSYLKFTYDDYNMVNSKYESVYDKSTLYWYNSNNDIIKKQFHDKTVEIIDYDSMGHIIKKVDRKGNAIQYKYDSMGNCIEEIYPDGLMVYKDYNEVGLLSAITDNMKRVEKREYDERGNIISIHKKINGEMWQKVEYIYDEFGRKISEKDGNGYEKIYEYTTYFSKPSVIINKMGQAIMYEYDMAGHNTKIYSENYSMEFEYDVFNRVIKIKDGEGNTTRFCYNKEGKLIRKILPNQYNVDTDNGQGIVYEYDKAGNKVKYILPSGSVTLTKRDGAGNIIKKVLPESYNPSKNDGDGTTYEYDKDGNCIRVNKADNSVERVYFDVCGNIIKKVLPTCYKPKDDNGEGHSYKYDSMNRVIKEIDPRGRVHKELFYDYAGNLIKEINLKGYIIGKNEKTRKGSIFTYDYMGNMIEKREFVKSESPGYRVTKYEYDCECNCTKEIKFLEYQMQTGAIGRTSEKIFEYDAESRLIKVTNSVGSVKEYAYDEFDKKIYESEKVNDKVVKWRKFTYDKAQRLIAITQSCDPRFTKKSSVDILYQYDKSGNIIGITTPKGYMIKRTYDIDNRITEEQHIDEASQIDNKISYVYDNGGNVSMEIDSYGTANSYFYDVMNRVVKKVNNYGGTHIFFYDASDRVIKEIKPDEFVRDGEKAKGWLYDYDIMGNLLKTTSPEGIIVKENIYNEYDELIQVKDAAKGDEDYKYDFSGRITHIKKDGETKYIAYDPFDRKTASSDGKYKTTAYELDEEGRVTTILHPDGNVEKYEYDYANNITEYIDIEGKVTSYVYNEINKLLMKTYPNGGEEKFAYDEEGNIAIIADRNKNGIENTYNIYGHLVNKKDMRTGICIQNAFYSDGKIKTSLCGGVKFGYEYDKGGRLSKRKINDISVAQFVYNNQGNIKFISDVSDKKITYNYDMTNRLTSISDGLKIIAEYEYNKDGTVKNIRMGDKKIIASFKYDKQKNISEQNVVMGSNECVIDNKYKYDDNGNCTYKKTLQGEFAYEFDNNNKPLKAQYQSHKEKICYDNTGTRTRRNVIKKSDSYAEFYSYTDGVLSERVITDPYGNVMGRVSYEYDNEGKILDDGSNIYTYDCFGQMVKTEVADGNILRYRYDFHNERYEVEDEGVVHRYIYDEDGKLIKEYSEKMAIQYIWGNGIPVACYIEKDNRYLYFITDNKKNVTHLVDGQFVVNTYDYDIFGTIIGWSETIPNRLLGGSRQYDVKTGFYYENGRYYDPVLDIYIN